MILIEFWSSKKLQRNSWGLLNFNLISVFSSVSWLVSLGECGSSLQTHWDHMTLFHYNRLKPHNKYISTLPYFPIMLSKRVISHNTISSYSQPPQGCKPIGHTPLASADPTHRRSVRYMHITNATLLTFCLGSPADFFVKKG